MTRRSDVLQAYVAATLDIAAERWDDNDYDDSMSALRRLWEQSGPDEKSKLATIRWWLYNRHMAQ